MGSAAPIIEWVAVEKTYRRALVKALDQVSFSVSGGEVVVLVGPNGSGKTTAMEMASGLRAPTSGEVRILGKSVLAGKARNLCVGVQLQEAGLPLRLRVKEAIDAVSCLYKDPGPVDKVIAGLGLQPYLNKMIDSLSGGWQKRLDVALACIGRPKVLVLDEPTSGLDPGARAELWEYLRIQRTQGVGVLVSTHDLSEAEAYADRLLVLHEGRLVLSGSVKEVLGQAGGDWRLRLIGVSSGLAAFAAANQAAFLRSGDSYVALGSKGEMRALLEKAEQARTEGSINYQDSLYGQIRLEDVFSFVTNGGGSDE